MTANRCKYIIFIFISSLLLSGFLLQYALLKFSYAFTPTITSDGTMDTMVTQDGNVYNIDRGTNPDKGRNLFHSFERFSVETGYTASFNGPNGIENILSRVTGGQQSMIDGLLRSTIPGANLYLLNPAGVWFGPNASLDVSGSFHVSTADYLKLSDGSKFFANPLKSSVLTTAPPAAFGFLGSPKDIYVISFLKVPEGKTISLIGGNLNILDGTLYASGGTINLISVASQGETIFSGSNFNNLNIGSFEKLGTIQVLDSRSDAQRPIDTEGRMIGNIDVSGKNGGNILIRGGEIILDKGYVMADTFAEGPGIDSGNIDTGTSSVGDAGSIALDVEKLTLYQWGKISTISFGSGNAGDITVNASEYIFINEGNILSYAKSTGDGGVISIFTPSLLLGWFGAIVAGTYGEGDAGSIILDVGTLSSSAYISTGSFGSGKGGDITVKASKSVFFNSGGGLGSDAFSTGDGGVIYISTPSLWVDGYAGIGAGTYGEGDAGSITLDLGKLTLTGGGGISTSSRGSGKGGDITVKASESVLISGGDVPSGIYSGASSTGEGGVISMSTPSLNIDNGVISAGTSSVGDAGNITLDVGKLTLTGGGGISTSSWGSGKGGDLTVNASESVFISGFDGVRSGLSSDTTSTGDGGVISISTPSLVLENGGYIKAETSIWGAISTIGEGDAGSITLDVGKLTLTKGGYISTSSFGSGKGGDLTVNASESVFIGPGGLASTAMGTGDGGVISIKTPYLFLSLGGAINAGTGGEGDAGSIALEVGKLTLTGEGSISTSSSGFGKGGDLTVNASESVFISGYSSDMPFGLYSNAVSIGDGGVISISTPSLVLENGDIMAETYGEGDDAGDAGSIALDVGKLTLTGGRGISTSSSSSGKGGDITVKASESVFIDSGGLYSDSSRKGDGGKISIKTPSLVLDNEGVIRAETIGKGDAGSIALDVGKLTLTGGGGISTSSSGSGKGGDLTVKASESVFIDSGGLYSDSSRKGDGGHISIFTPSLELENAAFVSAKSSGRGNAGNINISAETFRSSNSSVTTEAKQADGGNIEINANNIIYLEGSQITSSVGQGLGKGGNITIDPDFVILNGSKIIANAYGGPGGNIRIVANKVFLADPESLVSASSALGIDGTVDIQSPINDISGSMVPLQQNFLSAASLLRNPCEARIRGGESSSFIVVGRDGLPIRPGNVLPSPINLREYFEIESSSKGAYFPEGQN